MARPGMTQRARLAIALLCAVAFVRCGGDPVGPVERELEAAWSRWVNAGYESYSFTTQRLCECPSEIVVPLRITVTNGEVTEVTVIDTDEPLDPEEWYTINDIFSLIRIELDRLPSRLEVTYDATLGFPAEVSYGEVEIDAGAVITVSDVTALAPGRRAD